MTLTPSASSAVTPTVGFVNPTSGSNKWRYRESFFRLFILTQVVSVAGLLVVERQQGERRTLPGSDVFKEYFLRHLL